MIQTSPGSLASESAVETGGTAAYHRESADVSQTRVVEGYPMTVQCPNCGHSGTLPSNMESGQHKIRCRRCGVKFETQPKAAEQNVDAEPEIDLNGLSGLATELGIEPESQADPAGPRLDMVEYKRFGNQFDSLMKSRNFLDASATARHLVV
jgi:ribosomal protein S27E